jgi:hypothetical protein
LENFQVRQAHALQRAVEYLQARDTAAHLKDLPPAYHVQVEKLALAAQRVAMLGERQGQGTDAIIAEGTTGVELRHKLRETFLIPLARVCRPRFRSNPGMRHAFHVPHKNKKSAVVVEAAQAMLKALSGHVDVLVEEGFSAKTLEELKALTDQLAQIAEKAQAARDARSRLTRELAQAIARGFELVRNVEGFLLVRFRTNKTLRTGWMSARKVPGHLGYSWNWHRHASPGRKGLIKPKRRK